jgi:hypothetical protein
MGVVIYCVALNWHDSFAAYLFLLATLFAILFATSLVNYARFYHQAKRALRYR